MPCSPTANAASARNTAVAGEVRAYCRIHCLPATSLLPANIHAAASLTVSPGWHVAGSGARMACVVIMKSRALVGAFAEAIAEGRGKWR